jgi:molecular chaperone Hsp33
MEDYIIRADAASGMIRAFACATTGISEKARQIHNTSPVVTAALGRLLSAGVMMGSMMKDERDLLTLKIDGTGPLRGMIVTADCEGHVKGYPYQPVVLLPPNSRGKLDVGGAVGKGILSVISDIGLKEPYSGQVSLQSGEIAEDIAYYYASSEQVPTAVGLGVLMSHDNTVRCSGGYLFQLMPGCPDEIAGMLEERIKKADSVTDMMKKGMRPEDIVNLILEGLEPSVTDKKECSFHCGCSRRKVEKALITVGEKELTDMIGEGKDTEVSCHFCRKTYHFSPDDLRVLLKEGRQGHPEADQRTE